MSVYPGDVIGDLLSAVELSRAGMKQDVQDDLDGKSADINQQLSRVENLVAQFVRQREADSTKRRRGTQLFTQNAAQCTTSLLPSPSQTLQAKRASLGDFLKSMLPLPQVARFILNNGRSAYGWIWLPTTNCPITQILLGQSTLTLATLPQTIHPVIFARKLVELALCLIQPGLKQTALVPAHLHPDQTARSYIDAAHHLTSQDLLVKSVDGLEALLLEALYQVHVGNMDMSAMIFRRAVGIAQAIELHRLPETADDRVRYLWFRLVYSDMWHSLSYGLSSGVMDTKPLTNLDMYSISATRRLDVRHIEIAGRVISRNVRLQHSNLRSITDISAVLDRRESDDIDRLLKEALRCTPVGYWEINDIHTTSEEAERDITAKLVTQMHQYYLTILVHQPWVLLAVEPSPNLPQTMSSNDAEYYAQITSLCAARGLLSRVPPQLSFPHLPGSLKGTKHKIYAAATTILLLHLHNARSAEQDMLGHQRIQDLNFVADTLSRVGYIYGKGETGPHGETLETLKRLLALALTVTDTSGIEIDVEWCSGNNSEAQPNDQVSPITVAYPYFGKVRVTEHHRLLIPAAPYT